MTRALHRLAVTLAWFVSDGGTPAYAAGPGVAASPALETLRVERAPNGRGILVDLAREVAAPLEAVEQAIRDVGAYPSWMPNTRAARLLTSDGEALVFDATVHLPWPLRDVTERIKMTRTQWGGEVRIAWQQVHGDLRLNQGSWTLVPRGPHRTWVRYQAQFQLRSWVPMFLVRRAQRWQAPRLFQGLEGRATVSAPAGTREAQTEPVAPRPGGGLSTAPMARDG